MFEKQSSQEIGRLKKESMIPFTRLPLVNKYIFLSDAVKRNLDCAFDDGNLIVSFRLRS